LAVIQDAKSVDQDNICQYWDVASGMIVGKTGVGGRGQRRSWSPDSKFLAIIGGSDGDQDVEIWDAADGKTLQRLAAPKCVAAEWSPTGEYLATARIGLHSEDGANLHHYKVQIWKVADAEMVREFTAAKSNTAVLAALDWSPDEKQIVTHIGSSIDLWNAETGERVGDEPLIKTAEFDEQRPHFLSWAVTGKTLLYCDAGVAKLWDFATNTTHHLAGRPDQVALEPDSLSSATELLTIRAANERFEGKRSVWDLKSLKYITREDEIAVEQAISPDGKLLAVLRHVDRDADQQLVLEFRVCELPDMKELHTTQLTATLPPNITWSPDSSKICLSFNHQYSPSGSLRVLDARKGTLLWRQGKDQETTRARPGPRSRVRGLSLTPQSVAWSPDSQRLAWWEKGSTVVLSDANTGESQHTLSTTGRPEPAGRMRSSYLGGVVWSADGHRLAYTIGSRLAIWRIGLEFPELLADVPLPAGGNRASPGLKFSPDGKFVSLREYPDQIHVWDTSSGGKKVSWANDERSIQWHGWLPDSQRIVFRDSDSLAVWKLSDQSIRRLPQIFTRGYNDSTHSGGLIAISTGAAIELLDDRLEQKLSILPDLDSLQQALFITPQGQYDITPMAELPRVVVLENDTQRLMTVQAFAEKYGWKNDPDAVAAWSD
jgi:WD40 repeat protein